MVKYSDHYSTDGNDRTAIADPVQLIPHMATTLEDATAATGPGVSRGIGHGRLRYKRAFISVNDADSNDVLRMMTFRSSDRISGLWISSDGVPTTATNVDVGLYTHNAAHDGALIDVDLYHSTLSLEDANNRLECFTGGVLTGINRGQPIWETLATGAGTDTTDPDVLYDLVITFTTDSAGEGDLILEAYYSSGD